MGKPLLFASYKVAYEVIKVKKLHTIVNTLIEPCALEMVKTVLGVDTVVAAIKLERISLSDNVNQSRIGDIGADILCSGCVTHENFYC